MKINLKNKLALITAASSGIGLGVAKTLSLAGAQIAICARNERKLNESAKLIVKETGSKNVLTLAGDIGNIDFLEKMVDKTTDYFGKNVDILINNNGGPPSLDTFEITENQWREALDINLMSVIRLCKLVAPEMKKKGWGRIVNLTSMVGKEPEQGLVLSSVARAGVSAYSKTIAQDLGPFGITANTILTGGCLTERLFDLLHQEIEGTDENIDDAISRISESVPTRFIAKPEQFAQTILYLVSEEASFLNGTSIPLDGGVSKSIF